MAKQTSTLPQYQYKKKHGFFYNLKKYRILTLMCVPAIVFFFAFNYMPLPGIYVAFVKYNYRDGIFGSKFVGLKNFEFLMQSGKLLDLTKNTILYNLAFIFLGNIIAMLMAVLLNEIHNKYFKKVSQTLMFLPYFISQVLVGFLVFNLLNYDTGFINGILVKLGMEKWQPYSDKSVWPPILIVVYLWQVTGYNSVVYFASICGIDTSIIEAARVDGANCFQKIRYIVLPSLRSSANETESDSLLRDVAHAVPMPMTQATRTLGTVATCATRATTAAGINVQASVASACNGLRAAKVMAAPYPMAKHPSMGMYPAITPPSAQMTSPATSDEPPRGACAPSPAGTIPPCSGEAPLELDASQSASALVCSSVRFSTVMT